MLIFEGFEWVWRTNDYVFQEATADEEVEFDGEGDHEHELNGDAEFDRN